MMAAVMATGAYARDTVPPAEQRTLAVCMDSSGNFWPVLQARAIASQIFARVGVRLDWHGPCGGPSLGWYGISIRLSDRTPADHHPGSLAYAMPYEGSRIVVFYDRVRAEAINTPVPVLLGHVLAHEIAHLLEGMNRHSASGIMKQQWDGRDYSDMCRFKFGFAADDMALMGLRLDGSPPSAGAEQ